MPSSSIRLLHRTDQPTGKDDEDEMPMMVTLPLNSNEPVMLEQHGTDYVIVFPLGKSMQGTVDEDEIVPNPRERCRDIFRQRGGQETQNHIAEELFQLDESVSQEEFQQKVRVKMLQMLMEFGIGVHGYRSIDQDEMFILLSTHPNAPETKITAMSVDIMARINPAKVDVHRLLRHGDRYPMTNYSKEDVYAFMLYDGTEKFDKFHKIDEIRIIDRVLNECFFVHELFNHKVVQKMFPLGNSQHILGFMSDWADFSWRNAFGLWPPAAHGEIMDKIRNYYGESIAFFFLWYAEYIKYLIPLAITSVLVLSRRLPALGIRLWWQRYIQIGYTGGVILWAATFNKFTTRSCARSMQMWGTKNMDSVEASRDGYKHSLDGSLKLLFTQMLVGIVMVIYLLLFLGAIHLNTTVMSEFQFGKYESIGTTVIIMIFNIGWSSVAPLLAGLQNHRTNSRYEKGLVMLLAPMKIFLTLVPFLLLAFVRRYSHHTCAPTLKQAALNIYGNMESMSTWPEVRSWVNHTIIESTQPGWADNGSLTFSPDLDFLDMYSFKKDDGQMCIMGCYPASCDVDSYDDLHCLSNCSLMLDTSLITFYLSHAASTLAFVIIGILLTKFDIYRERSKHRAGRWPSKSAAEHPDEEEVDSGGTEYTISQLQAKMECYKYGSWGGSREEDFMELAISFALLTCFSAQVPSMAIPSLLCNLAEYRFLAFRMVAVTQRPFPQASDGIGIWQEVFDAISKCAVIVNCALFVFSQSPLDHAPQSTQYLWFISLENIGIVFALGVSIFIPSLPTDVQNIAECYSRLVARIRFSDAGGNPGEQQQALPAPDKPLFPSAARGPEKKATLDDSIVQGLKLSDGMHPKKRQTSFVQIFKSVACASESGSESSSSE